MQFRKIKGLDFQSFFRNETRGVKIMLFFLKIFISLFALSHSSSSSDFSTITRKSSKERFAGCQTTTAKIGATPSSHWAHNSDSGLTRPTCPILSIWTAWQSDATRSHRSRTFRLSNKSDGALLVASCSSRNAENSLRWRLFPKSLRLRIKIILIIKIFIIKLEFAQ